MQVEASKQDMIEDLKEKDMDKYFQEVNKIYKENEDKPNLKKLLMGFDKLSVKERNVLINLFNLMLDDKKYSGKLWNQIMSYVKEDKLTNKQGQDFAKLGRDWPKVLKIDFFREDDTSEAEQLTAKDVKELWDADRDQAAIKSENQELWDADRDKELDAKVLRSLETEQDNELEDEVKETMQDEMEQLELGLKEDNLKELQDHLEQQKYGNQERPNVVSTGQDGQTKFFDSS